jgi:hypothetical protein
MPKAIFDWISAFLSNRSHVTKFNGCLSRTRKINKGVIQGSVMGPVLFSVMIADLKTKSALNLISKYADDVTVLSPKNSDTDLSEKLAHIQLWSTTNGFSINLSKTKEIVFHRPNPRLSITPAPLCGVERVSVLKLLGVSLSHDLRFSEHVSQILTICNQRMFLLKSFKNRGLCKKNLEIIFNALIVSKLLYALPAWGGFISAVEIARINAILRKCTKFGYSNAARLFSDLLVKADHKLFYAIRSPSHSLNYLLPPLKNTGYATRSKSHNFVLPHVKYDLYKKLFIILSLFNSV